MIILTPAYGKDYKSLRAAQEDFDKGVDFYLVSVTNGFAGYCSIRDFDPSVQKTIQLRYKNKREVGFLKIKPLVEEKSTFYID